MEIYLENSTDEDIAALEEIVKRTVEATLAFEHCMFEAEISVSFVTDGEIRELNRTYRNMDSVTDVLSFPLAEGKAEIEKLNAEAARLVALGDIVLAINRAKEQAQEFGHSIEREIGFLTAHSMLHLLGYDHMTHEDEKEMFGKQEEILCGMGLER